MIPKALLKKYGSQDFNTIIEVSNMRRCSGKANKSGYIYRRGTSRDIATNLHILCNLLFASYQWFDNLKEIQLVPLS